MGLRDTWGRALVYFGIAEEEEYWDEESFSAEDQLERSYAERPNVRRLKARRDSRDEPSWSEPDASARTQVLSPERRGQRQARNDGRDRDRRRPPAQLAAVPTTAARVHLVIPKSFNDAQSIADRFKLDTPVIINLQSADADLSKRLIDFSSGLTYALEGSMQRIADKVFLLTPRDVEVSAEERAKLVD
ncbi:MAG: cell division protein SepF, partial [Gaiellales bacterium]